VLHRLHLRRRQSGTDSASVRAATSSPVLAQPLAAVVSALRLRALIGARAGR
jgi:hypothetical protein